MIRRLPLRVCFSAAIAMLLAIGCDRLPGKPTAADIEPNPDQILDFPELFSQNCAGCHGQNGNGNAALALANPVYLAIANDDVLRRATADGVPHSLMPPFARSAGGTLTDQQIDVLVEGMRKKWGKPDLLKGENPPPYASNEPADPARGHQVFITFCAPCHGDNGQGTTVAGSVVDGSYLALISDQNLRTTIIAGRPDFKHPDWRSFKPGTPVSSQQITDVVAWIASHRPKFPGEPYPQTSNP